MKRLFKTLLAIVIVIAVIIISLVAIVSVRMSGQVKAFDKSGIPANVKHWHGAAADSWFSHLDIEIEGEDTSNEWCESVTDEDYLKIQ